MLQYVALERTRTRARGVGSGAMWRFVALLEAHLALGHVARARAVKIVRRYMGLSVGEMRCIFSFILNLNSKEIITVVITVITIKVTAFHFHPTEKL